MELSLNLGFPGFSSTDRDAFTRSSDGIGGGTTAGGVKGDDRVDNYGYLRRLEDEIRKIEPFRRELPLCMILLESTIEKFRMRTQHEDKEEEATEKAMPSIEELFPLKRKSDEGESGEVSRTGMKRMSCDGDRGLLKSDLNGVDGCDKPARLDCMSNSVGENCRGLFPLQNKSRSCVKPGSVCSRSLMSLTSVLANPAAANGKSSGSSRLVFGSSFVADQMKLQKKTHNQQQQQQMMQHQQNQGILKKQRRSWSPELHRRFLEVLQKLGGAQVATPKQIREMMKVQGLTNDEVKSHLQKYRLNIQKLPLPCDHTNPISKKWNKRRGEEEGEEEECRENSDGHSWVTGHGEKQLVAS